MACVESVLEITSRVRDDGLHYDNPPGNSKKKNSKARYPYQAIEKRVKSIYHVSMTQTMHVNKFPKQPDQTENVSRWIPIIQTLIIFGYLYFESLKTHLAIVCKLYLVHPKCKCSLPFVSAGLG